MITLFLSVMLSASQPAAEPDPAIQTAPATAATASPSEPASDVYAVARPGDSRMACSELKAAIEAIDAEVVAQNQAYAEETKRRMAVRTGMSTAYMGAAVAADVARVPFSDAGLAAARAGIRAQQSATRAAGVAARQTVVTRQMEMNRRLYHLSEIYFAKDCALTAEADPPK